MLGAAKSRPYLCRNPSERLPSEPLATPQDERRTIAAALDRYNGHRARTASALGMDRTTLWRKMKRLGLDGLPKNLKRLPPQKQKSRDWGQQK